VQPLTREDEETTKKLVRQIGGIVEWSNVGFGHGRAQDTYAPLMAVGEALDDRAWLAYVEGRIAQATEDLSYARDLEPEQVAYSAVLNLALDQGGGALERVELRHVRQSLTDDGHDVSSVQIGVLLRGAGFLVAQKGGKTWVYTGGEDNLKRIGNELNIDDDWLTG
jgi:hypothetical protein